MARETFTQTSFNAGVLSPRLLGRSDYQKYANSVATLSNAIPLVSGPATFRPGTIFVGDTYNNTAVRLIPFKYSTEQAYMLEFSDNRIRFFKDRGVILSTTAISNGTFTTDLTGWTDADTGTGASAWVGGTMELAGGAAGVAVRYQALTYMGISQYTVTCDVATNSVVWRAGTTAGGAEISSGTVSVGTGQTFSFTPTTAGTVYLTFRNANNNSAYVDNVVLSTPEYALDSPYDSADLSAVSYAQDRNAIYFALKSDTVPTKVLQRVDHSQWTLSSITTVDGPYLDTNTTTITLTPAATTGATTLTASSAVFASTDVGRLVRLRSTASGKWGYCTITGFTSSTLVDVTVNEDFESLAATARWRLGAFSQTTGYPGKVCLHEFRMILANTRTNPNMLWASESQGVGGATVLYSPTVVSDGTVTDSNSFYAPLTAGDVSEVAWMSSGASLVIGTEDSEWIGEPGDTAEGISPTNFRLTRRTNHGSLPNVNAVRIDGTVMYAKGTGSRINKFVFDFTSDKYMSTNVSLTGEVLFANKTIVDMAYAPEPFSCMWVVMDDGTLNSLTYVDSEEVGGWAQHKIAGYFGISSALSAGQLMGVLGLTYSARIEWGIVEAVAVIPASDRSYSEVWLVVKRTIGGVTARHIEIMADCHFSGDLEDAIYVDSSLTYDGGETSTISGLSHLEGEEVVVFSDGYRQDNKTVTAGAITLDEAASKVTVGLAYEGDIKTLDFETTNSFGGSSLGQIRRISDVSLRLFETAGLWVARADQDDDDLNAVDQVVAGHVMGLAPDLRSGIVEVDTASDWSLSSTLHIQMRSPFPATVSAIMMKAQVNEG